MAKLELINPIAELTDKYYIRVRGKKEVFTKLGWTPKLDPPNGKTNLFGDESVLYTYKAEGASQQSQRQKNRSGQPAAMHPVIFTLQEKTPKQAFKKIQFSVPAPALIIWITYIINKNCSNISKADFLTVSRSGTATWKHGTGGRFDVAVIPDDVIKTSVDEYLATKPTPKSDITQLTTIQVK